MVYQELNPNLVNFQVDLSDSENEWGSDEEGGGGKGGPDEGNT